LKAIVLKSYGKNAVLEVKDVKAPDPGPNQVLIRPSYAGLNPVDYKIRNGELKAILKLNFPHVVGCEVAGDVIEVGPGVTTFKPGDRVFTRLNTQRMGGFAEIVLEDEGNVAHSPPSIDDSVLAGIPLVALTAWQALHNVGKLKVNQRVLIHGGGGAVGRFAIQIAKAAGAHVTTTVSDWAEQLVKSLGADVAINYKKQRFDEMGETYDLIFDLVGADTLDRSYRCINPGGKVISIAGVPEPNTAEDLAGGFLLKMIFRMISSKQRKLARSAQASYRFVFMKPDGSKLQEIGSLLESGALKSSIDKVFSIKDVNDGYAYLESGNAKGKVVFKIDFHS